MTYEMEIKLAEKRAEKKYLEIGLAEGRKEGRAEAAREITEMFANELGIPREKIEAVLAKSSFAPKTQ